jgi:hypothetical protein
MTDPDESAALVSFRRVAVKRGLLPGVLQGNCFADFAVVMAAAALALDEHREYSEAEVNAVLKAWLAGAGAMLATDHVELRRWLVDCRLVARDGFGRRYMRASAPEPFTAAVKGLSGIDLAAVAREACSADALARAERKARWESSQGPTKAQMR